MKFEEKEKSLNEREKREKVSGCFKGELDCLEGAPVLYTRLFIANEFDSRVNARKPTIWLLDKKKKKKKRRKREIMLARRSDPTSYLA